jgi:hypothetical protein
MRDGRGVVDQRRILGDNAARAFRLEARAA